MSRRPTRSQTRERLHELAPFQQPALDYIAFDVGRDGEDGFRKRDVNRYGGAGLDGAVDFFKCGDQRAGFVGGHAVVAAVVSVDEVVHQLLAPGIAGSGATKFIEQSPYHDAVSLVGAFSLSHTD